MKYSDEDMREILFSAFNGNISETDEQTRDMLALFLTSPSARSTFEEDLLELVLDQSKSFVWKARKYVELEFPEDSAGETKAKELFKTIWSTVINKPWPRNP